MLGTPPQGVRPLYSPGAVDGRRNAKSANKGARPRRPTITNPDLGTYNGGILQNINTETFQGIRTSGGWIETFFYWTPCLHNHVGYGCDDPIDRDVSETLAGLGRTFNSVLFANMIWDLNQNFRVGFEFTWRETNYKFPLLPDNEGAGFHTQVQWAF